MRPPPIVYESAPGCARAPLAGSYRPRQPEKTTLYQTIQAHLETFLDHARELSDDGAGVPAMVEKEFRNYLSCGVLAHGFARLHCEACGRDRLLPFSCKGRAICPSCTTRRMHDTAAHLVDRVVPFVPVRQWVLTFPWSVRLPLAYDPTLLSGALTRFIRALFAYQRRRARALGLPTTRAATSGTITFVQRFGSALQLTPHFHVLLPDGVFVADPHQPDARPRFHRLDPPTDDDVATVLHRVARAVLGWLGRRGQLSQEAGADAADAPPEPLQTLSAEALTVPLPRSTRTAAGAHREAWPPPPRTAAEQGFSLHADRVVHEHDRDGLEQLCRYGLRPAVSADRLRITDDGRLVYRLKRTFSDGTREILLTPTQLLRRLAALVPRPRVHMLRYHGVFAARGRARRRARAAPAPLPPTVAPPVAAGSEVPVQPPAPHRPRRLPWAELLRRVHRIDVLRCEPCGGRVQVLAFLTDPGVVAAILRCLGLPAAPPQIAPARAPPDPVDVQ